MGSFCQYWRGLPLRRRRCPWHLADRYRGAEYRKHNGAAQAGYETGTYTSRSRKTPLTPAALAGKSTTQVGVIEKQKVARVVREL